jgi:hypothetical protein
VPEGLGTYFSMLFLGIDQILGMETIGLRYDDHLEGASNFLPWKEKIMFLLKENGQWSHENTTVTVLTNLVELSNHEARKAKAMWMILYSVRDHLVPHLFEKKVNRCDVSVSNVSETLILL